MRQFKSILVFFVFLLIGSLLLIDPGISQAAVSKAFTLCATAILPTLFPFFVLADLWIRTGNAEQISILSAPVIEKLFHLSGNIAPAFLLGMVGGYPVGARTIGQLYKNEQITKEEAEQALLFCNNAGPAFLIGFVGGKVFRSTYIGLILFVIHVSSAIWVGILTRPKKISKVPIYNIKKFIKSNISNELTKSITNGGQTAILVCTYIILFSIIIEIAAKVIPSSSFTIPLLCLMELTNGLDQLIHSQLPMHFQFVFASFLLGFGGLSILLQSSSLLFSAGLQIKKLMIGKLLHGLCSAFFAMLLYPAISQKALPVFYNMGEAKIFLCQNIFGIQIPLIFLFITKITTGKQKNNRI